MSSRTPNTNGLTIAPSNPEALSAHSYWGSYADEASLPNNTVPAAFALPGFAHLQAGDTAYTAAEGALWVCTSTGTAGAGDAVWASLGGAFATVRDAHVVVVGQSSAPYLDVVTDADFLDTGDGAGLALALASAAVVAGLADVRLRPCDITYAGAGPAGPLTVPTNTRLIGAGYALSTVRGRSAVAEVQSIFSLDDIASAEDMAILSPAPTGIPGASANLGVVQAISGSANQAVRRCRIEADGGAFARNVTVCVAALEADGVIVEDCSIRGMKIRDTLAADFTLVGFAATAVPGTINIVRNCDLSTADIGVGTTCPGVRVEDCEIVDIRHRGVSFAIIADADFATTFDLEVDGCTVVMDLAETNIPRKSCVYLDNAANQTCNDPKVCNSVLRTQSQGSPINSWHGVYATGPGSFDRLNVSNNNIRHQGGTTSKNGVTLDDVNVANTLVVANGIAGTTVLAQVNGVGIATAEIGHNV